MYKYLLAFTGFLTISISCIQSISQRSSIVSLTEHIQRGSAAVFDHPAILVDLLGYWHPVTVFGIILTSLALMGMPVSSHAGGALGAPRRNLRSGDYQRPISTLIVGLTLTCLSISGKSAASFAANQIWSSILRTLPGGEGSSSIAQGLAEIQKPWNLPLSFGLMLTGISIMHALYILALKSRRLARSNEE